MPEQSPDQPVKTDLVVAVGVDGASAMTDNAAKTSPHHFAPTRDKHATSSLLPLNPGAPKAFLFSVYTSWPGIGVGEEPQDLGGFRLVKALQKYLTRSSEDQRFLEPRCVGHRAPYARPWPIGQRLDAPLE